MTVTDFRTMHSFLMVQQVVAILFSLVDASAGRHAGISPPVVACQRAARRPTPRADDGYQLSLA